MCSLNADLSILRRCGGGHKLEASAPRRIPPPWRRRYLVSRRCMIFAGHRPAQGKRGPEILLGPASFFTANKGRGASINANIARLFALASRGARCGSNVLVVIMRRSNARLSGYQADGDRLGGCARLHVFLATPSNEVTVNGFAGTSQQGGQAARRGRRHLPKRGCHDIVVSAMLLEQNEEWVVQRARHMTL